MEENCQIGFYYTLNHIITIIDESVQSYFNAFIILFYKSLSVIEHSVNQYFIVFDNLFRYSLGYPQVIFLTFIVFLVLLTFLMALKIIFK